MIHTALAMILCVLISFCPSARSQHGLNDRLQVGVDQLRTTITPSPSVLAVGSFTYAGYDMGSMFSRYLEHNLSLLLSESGSFEVFDKGELEEILKNQQLCLTDLVDPTTAPEIGRLKGIRAILNGTYFDEGDSVAVMLKLASTETGTVLSQCRIAIPKAVIPTALHLLPENHQGAQFLHAQLRDVLDGEGENLIVRAWTTRGNGATYGNGEELVANFIANMNCYVKVFHIDAMKKTQLIFPNEYHRDNMIASGKVYSIPDASYPFRWVLEPPYGTEFIKVIASTVQFADVEKPFSDLGNDSRLIIERGLRVEQRKSISAEALLTYTVVE